MKYLFATGRAFFGICIAGIGVMHFFYPGIRPIVCPGLTDVPAAIGWLVGILLIIPGLLIIIGKMYKTISLLMAAVFLLLFLFGHLPAFLVAGPMNSDTWVKMNKVIAMGGGFLVLAAIDPPYTSSRLLGFGFSVAPIGMYFFAIMLYNFGVGHIVSMNGISTLVPKYIPFPKFWTFMGGIALIGSAISIFTRYKTKTIMLLLAAVLFIWLGMLHMYYAVRFPKWNEGENFVGVITCLAFCGIALMISQMNKKNAK